MFTEIMNKTKDRFTIHFIDTEFSIMRLICETRITFLWKGIHLREWHVELVTKTESNLAALNTISRLFEVSYHPYSEYYDEAYKPDKDFMKLRYDDTARSIDYFETHLIEGTYLHMLPIHLQKKIFSMVTVDYTLGRYDNVYASNDIVFQNYEVI
jgi:hypothetical protein